jgi:hypothetical protein
MGVTGSADKQDSPADWHRAKKFVKDLAESVKLGMVSAYQPLGKKLA